MRTASRCLLALFALAGTPSGAGASGEPSEILPAHLDGAAPEVAVFRVRGSRGAPETAPAPPSPQVVIERFAEIPVFAVHRHWNAWLEQQRRPRPARRLSVGTGLAPLAAARDPRLAGSSSGRGR